MKQIALLMTLVSLAMGVSLDASARNRNARTQSADAAQTDATAGDTNSKATPEERAKAKELADLERQREQSAREARCQYKMVMTDEEIAICREVHRK